MARIVHDTNGRRATEGALTNETGWR
jgi:hypothetical protein